MSRGDASRYLDVSRGLCAMKIGGWAPRELHEHEAEEVARDQAEGVRLAYVAATRARDLLVVPALGDEPWDGGWLSPLNRALYPPKELRRTAERGPKCPAFKSKDSVLQRPNDEPAGPGTVCPGRYTFDDGRYSVVWWDPGALTLGKKPAFGVRREDLIVKDVPRDVIADGRSRYDRWRLARHDARAQGSVPTLRVQTVREVVHDEDVADQVPAVTAAEAANVTVVDLAGRERDDRTGGQAFGLLVHVILAETSLDPEADELEPIASLHARALGMSEDDATAAAAVVRRMLSHDLLIRARRAEARGACRRETPVTISLADGTLVDGVVDLAFEEGGAWTVVDYKTDRELAAGEERYRRQVALYAAAIARATDTPVSAWLVRI
jgi:ATP-dependent exoDNAse (exonuclease V) beta subunit